VSSNTDLKGLRDAIGAMLNPTAKIERLQLVKQTSAKLVALIDDLPRTDRKEATEALLDALLALDDEHVTEWATENVD
jgi:hypothetical protein